MKARIGEPNARTMRVMIVEDDPLHRSFLRDVVTSAMPDCVDMIEASDGAMAIELFHTAQPHVVILDLQMPKVTGVEVAKEIWRRDDKIKILFWSSYSDEAYVRAISRIVPTDTAYGYVLKTASEEHLQLAIRGVFLGDQCIIDREIRSVQVRATNRSEGLSELEYEVLIDLALGLTDSTMAARRNLSTRGVQSRLQGLYEKLGIVQTDTHLRDGAMGFNSRTRAISVALERGLINLETLRREELALGAWLANTQAVR